MSYEFSGESRGLVLDPEITEEWSSPAPRRPGRRTILVGTLAALSGLVLGLLALAHQSSRGSVVAQGLEGGEELTELEEEEDENPCDKYPYLKYEVPNAVEYNNLANKGPDSGNGEGIVFKTIDLGEGAGDELDREVYMTVNATPGSTYKPFSPRLNGMQGKYASINLWSGSEVDLLFNFYDRESMKKLTLPEFAITFFDLDTGNGGHSAEYVTIGGFKSHHVTGSGDIKGETEVKIEKQPDGRTKFLATKVGTGADNPKDPNFLTAQQKNRAVTLLYGPTETLHVTIGATAGSGPRFFTFVGRPSLLCATTVQENYKPPLEDLTFVPPVEDATYVHRGEEFVSFAVKKGDKVKEGDLICTTKKDGRPPKEYKVQHDGTVTKLQDKLKPGDKLDERLSEKIIAVVERPTLEELPKDEDNVGGGPGKEADLPRETVFKKYLVKPGDKVQKGDPIAVVEKRDGGEEVEVKATECGVVKERQEEMKDGMLLEAVPDKNLITVAPFPALPTSDDNTPVASVPEDEAKDKTFEEYKVKKGDIVKEGDPIATVKDKDGSEEDVPAEKGGVISDLQDDLKPGTPMDRVEDGNLATVGKFPPLPVEPGMSPTGIKGSGTPAPQEEEEPASDGEETAAAKEPSEAGEEPKATPEPLSEQPPDEQDAVDPADLKFVKYYVEPEDVVETGDPIAQVEDKDGKKHDILAPKPGVVKHTQDGLKKGMVLDNVMQDENLATIDRLPALDVGPGQAGSFAPADENWEFKEWKKEVGEEVTADDPIAVLSNPSTGETMEVHAKKPGIVKERQEHLKPGDVVEQSTKDNNLAIVDCKGPEIAFREMGVEVPSMDCTFVDWKVKEGEKVHFGDPIADVECPSKERRLSGMQRRLSEMKPFTVPSPGTGWVNYKADLKPGQPIRAAAASPTIAKVNLGPPWWLALLGALLALCCCFGCLWKVMQKPLAYKPMPVPEPTPEPEAPPPEEEPKPDGVRLDFDENGTIRTVYAKYRPLGIHHTKTAPIVVKDFTVNSYAKQALGVKPEWKLTRIGDEELNDSTDFPEVTRKLHSYLKDFPVWPLPLEFKKEPDDEDTYVYKFVERPLGMEFTNVAPIRVEKVYGGSPAEQQNVEPGWFLTRIGEQDVHSTHNFREVMVFFKEGVQGLDERQDNA